MKGKTANPFGAFRKRTITALEFTRALASIAADVPTLYRVWIKHELDPGFREELMLAVSRVNDCKYCSWAHYEWANLEGIPEEELAQVEQIDPDHFDRKKWLALSYVRELVAVRFGPVSQDLMRQMGTCVGLRAIFLADLARVPAGGARNRDRGSSAPREKRLYRSEVLHRAPGRKAGGALNAAGMRSPVVRARRAAARPAGRRSVWCSAARCR